MTGCSKCGKREPIDSARVEVARCQRSVDRGGSRAQWIARLDRTVRIWECAATILRMQIAALEAAEPVSVTEVAQASVNAPGEKP